MEKSNIFVYIIAIVVTYVFSLASALHILYKQSAGTGKPGKRGLRFLRKKEKAGKDDPSLIVGIGNEGNASSLVLDDETQQEADVGRRQKKKPGFFGTSFLGKKKKAGKNDPSLLVGIGNEDEGNENEPDENVGTSFLGNEENENAEKLKKSGKFGMGLSGLSGLFRKKEKAKKDDLGKIDEEKENVGTSFLGNEEKAENDPGKPGKLKKFGLGLSGLSGLFRKKEKAEIGKKDEENEEADVGTGNEEKAEKDDPSLLVGNEDKENDAPSSLEPDAQQEADVGTSSLEPDAQQEADVGKKEPDAEEPDGPQKKKPGFFKNPFVGRKGKDKKFFSVLY